MGDYHLECLECGAAYDGREDSFRLACDHEISGRHPAALLRTVYREKHLSPLPARGIFRYAGWLPCGQTRLSTPGRPLVYRSRGLGDHVGLDGLHIAYSGRRGDGDPEDVPTGTFKAFEAPATIARYLDAVARGAVANVPLVIASAGNTANAFLRVASWLHMPIRVVVPRSGLAHIQPWRSSCALVMAVDGDYTDAIAIADAIGAKTGLLREGGARNVARRDGMGIVMLEAALASGGLFDAYFQAVGSGSGAIAAHEAALRLLADGRFGRTRTRLCLAQNAPYAPMARAFEAGASDLLPLSEEEARRAIAEVGAPVLTNRRPPYALRGGVREIVRETEGEIVAIANEELHAAAALFRETERREIEPAAAVAVAALLRAARRGDVRSGDRVLLHVTGGGALRRTRGLEMAPPLPDRVVQRDEPLTTVLEKLGPIPPLSFDESRVHFEAPPALLGGGSAASPCSEERTPMRLQ